MDAKKISGSIDDLFMCVLGPVDIEVLTAMADCCLVSSAEKGANIF
jgi:hypothetical protein